MPRLARVDVADHAYHVINRANGRTQIFDTPEDFALFEELLEKTKNEVGMRVLAYCIMPNHWHLVLYPRTDGDLGIFMHRLTNAHTRLVRTHTNTVGSGHLYQGCYKAFLIENDTHLLTVIKYVERNAARTRLAPDCESWRWGSACCRLEGSPELKKLLDESPTPLPARYRAWINEPDKTEELSSMRYSLNRGIPFGSAHWVDAMVDQHGLESTRRAVGRPKKS